MNHNFVKTETVAARKEKWDSINWRNADTAIAQFLGVSRKAVAYQRQLRGKSPRKRGGPRYPGKVKAYRP